MHRITHGDLCVNGSHVQPDTADQNDENSFNQSVAQAKSKVNKPSEQLLAANAQLLELCKQSPNHTCEKADQNRQAPVESSEKAVLPSHLEWGSVRFSSQLKHAQTPSAAQIEPNEDATQAVEPSPPTTTCVVQPVDLQPASAEIPSQQLPTEINVHPELLTAMLREEVESIGRIWLLARHLDQAGRGWVTVEKLRETLTNKASELRCVGWRRLRQILSAGEDQFWKRDKLGRLFLYSTLRVAKQLDLVRLTGRHIWLPVAGLTASIKTLRAHFYASFHSGRAHYDEIGMPISRHVLSEITGASERSQREYDQRLDVQKQANYTEVVDSPVDAYWERQVIFRCGDKLLRRLPNSYHTVHTANYSRQKKQLNQCLKQDLVIHGTQGNSNNQIERIFFVDGKKAAKRVSRGESAIVLDKGEKGRWATFKSVKRSKNSPSGTKLTWN